MPAASSVIPGTARRKTRSARQKRSLALTLPQQNDPPTPPPGKGLWGWLGRQIGYVAKAVKTDVAAPKIVYRDDQVSEAPHPTDPNLKLRRTVIDEVIEKKGEK